MVVMKITKVYLCLLSLVCFSSSQQECPAGRYGIKCNMLCGDGCLSGTCNRQTGSCTCKPRWGNPLCTEQNIARGASCNMSSTYPNSGNCSLSIDDNLDTTLRFNYYANGSNCIHSGAYDRTPTLLLDLGRIHVVNRLTVYARKNFVERMADTEISIDRMYCATIRKENITSQEIFDIKCTRSIAGQVINITRHSNISDFTMNICEVQIWECQSGYYGWNCSTPCGDGCEPDTCDKHTGECRCMAGWSSPFCKECTNSSYGKDCQHKCGRCSEGAACNKSSGECQSCTPGWYPPLCQNACNDSFYGQDCKEKCGHCSDGVACRKKSGECTKCEPGWYPFLCQNECANRTYGDNCQHDCGHCSGGGECNTTSGKCLSCDPGWIPPLCHEGCRNGTYGQDCGHTCGHCSDRAACNKTSGECLSCEPGWYPPFCQNECNGTSYGQDCQQKCGHCKNGRSCNKTNGHCLECTPGWIPPLCNDACKNGRYGGDCSKTCGHCKDGQPCNVITGECIDGCTTGWTGKTCDQSLVSYDVFIIAGAIISGFLILAVSISVTIWLKRSKHRSVEESNRKQVHLQTSFNRRHLQAQADFPKSLETERDYDDTGNPYDSLDISVLDDEAKYTQPAFTKIKTSTEKDTSN